MKKILMAIVMISVFLVPALMAQGKHIPLAAMGSDKLKITGVAGWFETNKYLGIHVLLVYKSRPVTNANIWLNKLQLRHYEGGNYYGQITPFQARVGNMLELAVEFPPNMGPLTMPPPFTGRKVLASYRIANIIEWVFPAPGQVIDLSAYSKGPIPFRWNFTGATVKALLELKSMDDPGRRRIYARAIEAESVDIPTSIFAPGNNYRITLDTHITTYTPMGEFTMSNLTAPGSSFVFTHDSVCFFSTKAAR